MLIKPLRETGFHTLRFNSRGVGSSTGWASFTGTKEGKDLEALVKWALGHVTDVESVVLIVSCGHPNRTADSEVLFTQGIFTWRVDRFTAPSAS
jgi:hypothetical protein